MEDVAERREPHEPRVVPRPPPPVTWRDHVDDLRGRARAELTPGRIVATVAAVVAAALVWIFLLRPAPPGAIDDQLPRAVPASSAAALTTTTAPATVVVQAAGAVVSPGVYTLPARSRVDDLIKAAGGLAPGADPDRVALAALLTDGERVYVPKVGESPPPEVGGASGGSGGSSGASSGPVDLNTATEAELEALPGIGPSLAQAIITFREQHGGFRSVEQLGDVRGIGDARLEQLRPLVTVG